MNVVLTVMNFFNITQTPKMVGGLLLGGCLLVVTFCGCSSYDSHTFVSAQLDRFRLADLNASRSPQALFPKPVIDSPYPFIPSSEGFGRYNWPVAAEPQGYASLGESMTYREYTYSDMYLSGDNTPRFHYHRRLQGYRYGDRIRY